MILLLPQLLWAELFFHHCRANEQTTGKILPSVGVALVPVKEAVAPSKSYEQNSASLVRSDIKRLQYLLTDNMLVGEKDPDIIKKRKGLEMNLTQVNCSLLMCLW